MDSTSINKQYFNFRMHKKTETLVKDENSHQVKLTPKTVESAKLSEKFYQQNHFFDALKFAGQIEKEALKLAQTNQKNQLKHALQLETLSYALMQTQNVKELPRDLELDCKRYQIREVFKNEIELLRICERPFSPIARIEHVSKQNFKITFNQEYWSKSVGNSAVFNSKNRICDLILDHQQVVKLSCLQTIYTVGSDAQLEELRITDLKFDRNSDLQLYVKGGRYRDLIERSQFKVVVPKDGKIKVNESELDVKDDFADLLNESNSVVETEPVNEPNQKER